VKKPYIVGITGGSASGKTLFLKSLLSSFSENDICLLSQDNYYKPRHDIPTDENGVHNFDTPTSIFFDEYARDLATLKAGGQVQRLEYTFNNPNKTPGILYFNPSPVVVVEGIFVFYYPELAKLLDLKVFIDAKEHIKLQRRINRDQNERGYGIDDVLYRYERHVAPTYEKYIQPFKNDADIIIPNNQTFQKGLKVLIAYLKTKIES